jgi:hypothetical protein
MLRDMLRRVTRKLRYFRQAALVLNQFLFQSDEWTAPKPRVQKSEAEDAVKQEQQQYVRQGFTDAQNDLQVRSITF